MAIDRLASLITPESAGAQFYYATYVAPETDPNLHHITMLGEDFHWVGSLAPLTWYMETVIYGTGDNGSNNFAKGDYVGGAFMRFRIQGGGGGGGGALGSASGSGTGGSGGGGCYGEGLILFEDMATTETITVGSGGGGGSTSGGNGSDGGATSIGSHASVDGGGGGAGEASPTTGNAGATRGQGATSSSGCDLTIWGGDGVNGRTLSGFPVEVHLGGASHLSSPNGVSDSVNQNGPVGSNWGGGGLGGVVFQNSTGRAGGDGADGLCILDIYGGPIAGSTVLCVRTKQIPLMILGVVLGDITTADVGS